MRELLPTFSFPRHKPKKSLTQNEKQSSMEKRKVEIQISFSTDFLNCLKLSCTLVRKLRKWRIEFYFKDDCLYRCQATANEKQVYNVTEIS